MCKLKPGDIVNLIEPLPFTKFNFNMEGDHFARYIGINNSSGKYMFQVSTGQIHFHKIDHVIVTKRRYLLPFKY